MGKIDKFYEKFNGSYFAFIGVGVSLVSIFIAIGLYMIADPTFSLFTHFLSDLGDGRNYSNVVFNISRILDGVILLFFYLYLSRYLYNKEVSKRLTWISFIGGSIYTTGLILVAVFTSQTAYEMHIIGAGFVFFGMFFVYLFYSISENSCDEFPKQYSILGFILAPLPLLFMIFILLAHFYGFSLEIAIFTEWITYFAMMSWIIIQGIYTIRTK